MTRRTREKRHPAVELMNRRSGSLHLRNIYRTYLGQYRGQPVWIVNGKRIKMEIYPCFEMGGNDQRYKFIPGYDHGLPPEIWIDDRSAIVELPYTVAHEWIEAKSMLEQGLSYTHAHFKQALVLENKMREEDRKECAEHTRLVNEKLGISLPIGIYRRFYGIRNKMRVYVVDGSLVRDVDTNFSNGGHALKNDYIPTNEIWLDMNLAVVDHLSVLEEALTEHHDMASGVSYRKAYEHAVCSYHDSVKRQEDRARRHEESLPEVSYGDRNYGSKGKAKKK